MSSPRGVTSMGGRRNIQTPKEAVSLLKREDLDRFRKNFFFPNDTVLKLPASADRVHTPPAGYVGVYETTLRAGLRFPPAPELMEILETTGICISQLSYRAMAIVAGLIVLCRGRGVRLTPQILARFGDFSSNLNGRVFFQPRGFIFVAKELIRHWSVGFFFVKNVWGFSVTWKKPTPLPTSLQISVDEIISMLHFRDLRDLQLEVKNIGNFLTEERLRRAGLFLDVPRSVATAVKKSRRACPPTPCFPSEPPGGDGDCEIITVTPDRGILSAVPLRQVSPREGVKTCSKDQSIVAAGDAALQVQDQQGMEEDSPPDPDQQTVAPVQRPFPSLTSKVRIPERVSTRTCTGYKHHEEWVRRRNEVDEEYFRHVREWNSEFVKIKYLQARVQGYYDSKCTEFEERATELTGCRMELSEALTTVRVLEQRLERTQADLVESQAQTKDDSRSLSSLRRRVQELEEECQRLRSVPTTDATKVAAEAVEVFKNSHEFKELVHDATQECREHIYDVELVCLLRESRDNGLVRGFYKGLRALHRQSQVEIDGITYSQASEDPASSSEEEGVVSGLREGQTDDEDWDS